MKWGLRILGCFDIITFLLFINNKFLFFLETFGELQFSMLQKINSIIEILVLLCFLITGVLLLIQKRSGLIFSFILIPLRFIFLYFTLDIISYLAYSFGLSKIISTAYFQSNWLLCLLFTEIMRTTFSTYWYFKLSRI
jgi:hypothetical protein